MENLQKSPLVAELFKTILSLILNFISYAVLAPALLMWIGMLGFVFVIFLALIGPLFGGEPEFIKRIPFISFISSLIPKSFSGSIGLNNMDGLLKAYFIFSFVSMIAGDLIKYIFKIDFKLGFITKLKFLLIFITACYTLIFLTSIFIPWEGGGSIIENFIGIFIIYIFTLIPTLICVSLSKLIGLMQESLHKTEAPEQI